MADSIVGGLFGITPQSYQQTQNQQALGQAAELAQMSPFALAKTGIGYGANRAVGAIGGALGAVDPQLQLISARNAVMREVDPNNPESIMAGAQKLVQFDPEGANALAMSAREAALKLSQVTKNLRERQGAEPIQQLIRAGKYTPASVSEYEKTGDIGKLVAIEKQGNMPSMVQEYQFAKTPEGGGFRGSFQDFVTARALASRPPGQPRPEQPPVPVVDPNTGKVILVSRDEAIAKRLTPASAMESLSPKEIQNREAKYPQAKTAVTAFETNANKLATDLETLANSKGLEGITGVIGGRTPAITKDARAAEALYKSIVARGGFNELQNLRNASPTGGALGNISNQEGQQLKNAFAPLELTQNASDLKAALLRAAQETRASAGRVKDTFDLTYEYKNQGMQGGQTPPSSKTPMSADDLVNKYLNK